MIGLQRKVLAHLRGKPGEAQTIEEIAKSLGEPDAIETVYYILEHAAANPDHGVTRSAGTDRFDARYATSQSD